MCFVIKDMRDVLFLGRERVQSSLTVKDFDGQGM